MQAVQQFKYTSSPEEDCTICFEKLGRKGIEHDGGKAHPIHNSFFKDWERQRQADHEALNCPGCRRPINAELIQRENIAPANTVLVRQPVPRRPQVEPFSQLASRAASHPARELPYGVQVAKERLGRGLTGFAKDSYNTLIGLDRVTITAISLNLIAGAAKSSLLNKIVEIYEEEGAPTAAMTAIAGFGTAFIGSAVVFEGMNRVFDVIDLTSYAIKGPQEQRN